MFHQNICLFYTIFFTLSLNVISTKWICSDNSFYAFLLLALIRRNVLQVNTNFGAHKGVLNSVLYFESSALKYQTIRMSPITYSSLKAQLFFKKSKKSTIVFLTYFSFTSPTDILVINFDWTDTTPLWSLQWFIHHVFSPNTFRSAVRMYHASDWILFLQVLCNLLDKL